MALRPFVVTAFLTAVIGCSQSTPESKSIQAVSPSSSVPPKSAAVSATPANQTASAKAAIAVDQTASQLAKLQGIWNPTGMVTDGLTLSPEQLKQYGKPMTLKDDRSIVQQDETSSTALTRPPVDYSANVLGCGYIAFCAKAHVTIDPSRNPKWIDLVIRDGPWKGKTSHGIYELEEDNLKLCLAKPDTARPEGFTSYYGNSRILTAYGRQK